MNSVLMVSLDMEESQVVSDVEVTSETLELLELPDLLDHVGRPFSTQLLVWILILVVVSVWKPTLNKSTSNEDSSSLHQFLLWSATVIKASFLVVGKLDSTFSVSLFDCLQ